MCEVGFNHDPGGKPPCSLTRDKASSFKLLSQMRQLNDASKALGRSIRPCAEEERKANTTCQAAERLQEKLLAASGKMSGRIPSPWRKRIELSALREPGASGAGFFPRIGDGVPAAVVDDRRGVT